MIGFVAMAHWWRERPALVPFNQVLSSMVTEGRSGEQETIATRSPAVGDSFPSFTLRTLENRPFPWRPGQTTVLSFCAFWCDTWKDQLPRVKEASRMTKGLPVNYATISVDGRWTERAKAAAVGTMLGDPGGLWSHGKGIDRVPYTLVIAPNGKIVWATYGTVRTTQLVSAVKKNLTGENVERGPIYLTFDDFPAERLSEELLDTLRAANVRATLFCIGDKVASSRALLQRAVREGHKLAIHSWAHDGDHPQLEKCVDAIRTATGEIADLYRPPGSEKVLDLQGNSLRLPVDDPYDYTRPGTRELIRRVLSGARANGVIQLHAGVQDTIEALPEIVRALRRRGFVFETLARP